jgi:ATP-binding protein involved in chromosome partitioning
MDKLLNVLKTIKYPEMDRDIVDFGMVKTADFILENEISVVLQNITNMKKYESIKKEILKKMSSKYPEKNISVELLKKDVNDVNLNKNVNIKSDEKLLGNIKHVIAVGSGKGGVGKSTVTVSLAIAMAKKGYKVGLLDADIWGPSVPTMMGTESEKPFANEKNKILPIENFGIQMMSIGYFLEENTPVIWRGPLVTGALKQFMTEVEWPELDYLFIDLPPGTGDVQLTLAQSAKIDGVIIVTTPQKIAYIDAIKGIVMFQKLNIPVIGLLENMSYFECPDTRKKHYIFGEGGGSMVSEKFNVPLLGKVPIDPKVTIQGDEGAPMIEVFPDSSVSKAYFESVEKIVSYFNE